METDHVTEALDNLRAYLNTVPEISERTFPVYEQEELLNAVSAIQTPCIGIVYAGLRPDQSKGQHGMISMVAFDVYVVGGESCNDPTSTIEYRSFTLTLLDKIRSALQLKQGPRRTQWRFQFEVPADVGKNVAYVQRWGYELSLFN